MTQAAIPEAARTEAVVRGTIWASVDHWVQQIVQLITFLVVGNLIGPDAFGAMVLAIVFMLFIHAFLVDGFSEALVQRATIEREHLEAAYWTLGALGLVATAIGYSAAPVISGIFSEPLLTDLIRWLSISFVFVGISAFFQSKLRREFNFRALAIRSALCHTTSAIVAIILAINGFGIWSLVVFHVQVRILDFIALSFLSGWFPRLRFSTRHFGELFHFGAHKMGLSIVGFFTTQIERIVIGYFLSPVALGLYSMGRRITDGIVYGFTGVIGRVALPTFSRVRHDPRQLSRALCTATRYASLVTFPGNAGLVLVAPLLVETFLRPEWLPMADILQILGVNGMFATANYLLVVTCLAVGRAELPFRMSIATFCVKTVVCLVAVQFGILALAAAVVAVTALTFPFWLGLVRHLTGIRILDYIMSLAPALVCTAIMAACVLAGERLLTIALSNATELAFLIGIGVLSYALAVLLMARSAVVNIVHLVRS